MLVEGWWREVGWCLAAGVARVGQTVHSYWLVMLDTQPVIVGINTTG